MLELKLEGFTLDPSREDHAKLVERLELLKDSDTSVALVWYKKGEVIDASLVNCISNDNQFVPWMLSVILHSAAEQNLRAKEQTLEQLLAQLGGTNASD